VQKALDLLKQWLSSAAGFAPLRMRPV
jgi:hypothetical protein